MSKASPTENAAVAAKMKSNKGKPMKREQSVKSTLPEGMKDPKAPGDSNKQMAGNNGGNPMRAAVAHLNRGG